MNVDDRMYARIQFTVSGILSNVRMMSDRSLLTGCSMMTCWSQLSGSTQRWRRCFDGEAVVDQTWCLLSFNFAGVMLLLPLTFLRRCPAVHSLHPTSQISFRPQPNSDELRGGIKSSNYYTLVTNDFHQFKLPRLLSQASRYSRMNVCSSI